MTVARLTGTYRDWLKNGRTSGKGRKMSTWNWISLLQGLSGMHRESKEQEVARTQDLVKYECCWGTCDLAPVMPFQVVPMSPQCDTHFVCLSCVWCPPYDTTSCSDFSWRFVPHHKVLFRWLQNSLILPTSRKSFRDVVKETRVFDRNAHMSTY